MKESHVPSLKGKNVLVVGLGKSGASACRFLKKAKARVTITDQAPRSVHKKTISSLPQGVQYRLGRDSFFSSRYDLVVVSPGVSWSHPELKRFRKNGIPVLPEVELGWDFVRPDKTVAVTGTNGKTTTTSLVGHILKKSGKSVVVGGNIGTPLTSLISKIKQQSYLVLEISSYQAEAHQNLHPDVAIWMNLTPDHLGRHKSMNEYALAKLRLFKNMTSHDAAILNRRDPWCRKMASRIAARKIFFPSSHLKSYANASPLPGEHNKDNVMAAAAAAEVLGISQLHIRKALQSFKGVAHRLELIRVLRGVSYINDSKATNVDSTKVALKSLTSKGILILGGQHKGFPYTSLIPLIKSKIDCVLTIGEAAPLIRKDLNSNVLLVACGALSRAVETAAQLAKKGDCVLLSPACASFDQFKNFEDRGNQFRRLVNRLK